MNFAKFNFHSPGACAVLATKGSNWLETSCLARPCQGWHRGLAFLFPGPGSQPGWHLLSIWSPAHSNCPVASWRFQPINSVFLEKQLLCLLVFCPRFRSLEFSLRMEKLREPDLDDSLMLGCESGMGGTGDILKRSWFNATPSTHCLTTFLNSTGPSWTRS